MTDPTPAGRDPDAATDTRRPSDDAARRPTDTDAPAEDDASIWSIDHAPLAADGD